jgi:hypothetical protein
VDFFLFVKSLSYLAPYTMDKLEAKDFVFKTIFEFLSEGNNFIEGKLLFIL